MGAFAIALEGLTVPRMIDNYEAPLLEQRTHNLENLAMDHSVTMPEDATREQLLSALVQHAGSRMNADRTVQLFFLWNADHMFRPIETKSFWRRSLEIRT